MFEEERLRKIVEYVHQRSRASVQELSELFHVSESTVRRDLKELEKRALLKRTHGGAVSLQNVGFEPTYSEKEDKYRDEKQRIAQKSLELIKDGDSIVIDSGTTTLLMAAGFSRFHNLTVVTNSINLIQKMSNMDGINVISTGGMLRKNTMALVGPTAEESLDKIHVDKAFIATNGLDLKYGLSTPSLTEASIKEKMMAIADQVFILADHSKIGMVSFAHFGNLPDVDAVVTGNTLTEAQKAEFGRLHIKLHLVDSQEE